MVLLAGLLSVAFAASDGDELTRNRRLLEKWKADPDHYERLRKDLTAFYDLPRERQDKIRELDRRLHESDPATQARLWAVLERYVRWLDSLPETERRLVLDAEDRVTVIRGLRQRQWIARLPRATREALSTMPPDQRVARIKQMQLEERRQRVLWQRALGGKGDPVLKPTRFSELPRDVQTFLDREIRPRLSKQDDKAFRQNIGWPEYPKMVAELVEKYPVLPPGPLGPVTSFEKLPSRVKELLRHRKGGKMPWVRATGKWPDFALAVSTALRNERNLPPLGASRPEEFPSAMQAFLREKLFPALSVMQRTSLEKFKGRWPDYPKRLLALARQHHLIIPGMSLPGPPEMWDAALVARVELSPEQNQSIELIGADFRESLNRIKKAGFKKSRRGDRGKMLREGK